MTPTRPYLVRAIYDWIIDNGMTPYILVNSNDSEVVVPRQYIKDDKIILNISPTATQDLMLSDDTVMFHARFDGQTMQVHIPMLQVMAIYTKENGQGMMFNEEIEGTPTPDPAQPSDTKARLKVVK